MSIVLKNKLIKKTKKLHYCCVCDMKIESGSTCYYQVNIFEGDFNAVYYHYDKECLNNLIEDL